MSGFRVSTAESKLEVLLREARPASALRCPGALTIGLEVDIRVLWLIP